MTHDTSVAVIGAAGWFPGGRTLADFWSLLAEGRSALREVPPERWSLDAHFDPSPDAPGKSYARWGGFIDDLGAVDPAVFDISQKEAAALDRQQLLLLDTAARMMSGAGLARDGLAGTCTGLYLGMSHGDQIASLAVQPDTLNAYSLRGAALCLTVNRVSHVLDLRGPSLAVDTGSSSSLVALHLACQALRSGEVDWAIAGGANLMVSPLMSLAMAKAWILSPTGELRSFDQGADGYVRGEGCGLVLLKRSADVVPDRERVLGVVRGSAVVHSGRARNGFAKADAASYREVIHRALAAARTDVNELDYIEGHGIGIRPADQAELQALQEVLSSRTPGGPPCPLGSVKANIGHLEWAGGAAGFLKVLLSLKRQQIPPQRAFRTLSLDSQGAPLPFEVSTSARDWPAGRRRCAGISSFGLGGSNAHVILSDSAGSR